MNDIKLQKLSNSMRIEITTRKQRPVSDEVLFRLFQRSFQQWSDNGIEAKFLSQNIAYFQNATQRAMFVLAFMVNDEGVTVHDGEPVGMLCVKCYKDKHAFDYYLTVAPEAKQMGVGTRMLDYAVAKLQERANSTGNGPELLSVLAYGAMADPAK